MKSKKTVEYLKFGLVITSIVLISYILYWLTGASGFLVYMRWFMGVFMVTFAAFKFVGYKTFVGAFAGYDLVAVRFNLYGKLFPFIQLLLGLLYILNWLPFVRDVAVLLIAGVASCGVLKALQQKKTVRCACLGNVIKLPLSTISLLEDLGMVAMAAAALLLNS